MPEGEGEGGEGGGGGEEVRGGEVGVDLVPVSIHVFIQGTKVQGGGVDLHSTHWA